MWSCDRMVREGHALIHRGGGVLNSFCHFLFLQKGDTPLHIAIRGRSRRLAELLLRNPKDGRLLYRPNKAGETPYNIDCSHQKSILTQIFGARRFSQTCLLHLSPGLVPELSLSVCRSPVSLRVRWRHVGL